MANESLHRDYRDDVIAEFAASERRCMDRVADLAVERDSYRLLAIAGIHHAHDLHVQNQRLRRQLDRLRDELRRYTAAQVNTSVHLVSRAA